MANSSQKLIKYDINGEFIEYKNLSTPGLFSFHQLGNHYYFYKGLQVDEEDIKDGRGFRLTRANVETPDKIEQRYLPFYFDDIHTPTSTVNFVNIRDIPNTNDTLVLFDQITDEVLSITQDGIQSRYLLEFEGEQGKKSIIFNDPSISNKSEVIKSDRLTYLLDWLENDQYIIIEYSYFSIKHKQRFVSKALFNKNTKQISIFQDYSKFMVMLDGIFWDLGKYSMYITNSGKYVCVLHPVDLISKIAAEKQNNSSDGTFNELVKKYKLENITESDNPILMIFNFSKN